VVVVVVEPNLADADYFGVSAELTQRRDRAVVRLGRIVRVDPDRGPDVGVSVGQPDRDFEIGRSPVPIAKNPSTPAARAASSTASRSSSKALLSRWQWESMRAIP
jgi:hypothetical protein